ncbi:hypothetical protein MVEN_01664700 [Mycena venus]|uniref:Uncharacterized protein n=1 Tax=Mycena venus TaxID=2733690 RepID=A0A8H6XR93_9AGAR|nr:hypothetical protein MVEN_01664700 [Mycena venus]
MIPNHFHRVSISLTFAYFQKRLDNKLQKMSESLLPAQAIAHRRAIEDVVEFLSLRSTVLPSFPTTQSSLRLACGQVYPDDEAQMKGVPLFEGGALLRAMLADHLPVLFSDTTPGTSTTVRDVLIADRVSAAVAGYFQWKPPSPGITAEELLWLMVHYCDLSQREELGLHALNRWAREFYRPLAIIARSSLYPNWAGEVIQTRNLIANSDLGNMENRRPADLEMEAYLVKGNFAENLDPNWLGRFPIAQSILDEPTRKRRSAAEMDSRKVHRLPAKSRSINGK